MELLKLLSTNWNFKLPSLRGKREKRRWELFEQLEGGHRCREPGGNCKEEQHTVLSRCKHDARALWGLRDMHSAPKQVNSEQLSGGLGFGCGELSEGRDPGWDPEHCCIKVGSSKPFHLSPTSEVLHL